MIPGLLCYPAGFKENLTREGGLAMRIEKVAFIGKGGVGLMYGSIMAKNLGADAV